MRLDRRVRELHPELSWTRIRAAIARGHVLVDGTMQCDAAAEISDRSRVQIDLSRRARKHARLDLPRLYEDDEILVVDKPAGLLTIPSHPSRRASEDTVLRRVREYVTHLRGPGSYVGTLHRLDRGTSGALALALSRRAHAIGREMFGAHRFDRRYLAVVEGVPTLAHGTIRLPISHAYLRGRREIARSDRGRDAITHYRVIKRFPRAALLELELETGRQHQIRAHLEHVGHPIVGDRVYTGGRSSHTAASRPMLHAWKLRFEHPLGGRAIEVTAPVPDDFEELLRRLAH